MRKMTPISRLAVKLLPASLLLAMAMPAHSVWIDQLGGARNGLQFQIYTGLNPEINNFSSKTTYLMADPTYYDRYDEADQLVSSGTMAQVFADQDRKDTDERNRIYGTESAYTQFIANQALNKDWRAYVGMYLSYTPNGHRNYGSGWGVGLAYKDKASFNIGTTGPSISVRQTDADPVLMTWGSNAYLRAQYTGVPNLTLAAAHALTSTNDDRVNSDINWRKHSLVSASYLINVSPYHQVTLGVAGSTARGAEFPTRFDQRSKNDGYMGSIAYRYRDVTVGLDYGKGKEKFNGVYLGDLDKTSYGAKVTYRFTPRFQGSLSYGTYETENSKSLSFQEFGRHRLGLNEQNYFFAKSKTDRYRINAEYSIRENLSLFGTVVSTRTKHHVLDERDNVVKPFAKNEGLLTAAGVSFSF